MWCSLVWNQLEESGRQAYRHPVAMILLLYGVLYVTVIETTAFVPFSAFAVQQIA